MPMTEERHYEENQKIEYKPKDKINDTTAGDDMRIPQNGLQQQKQPTESEDDPVKRGKKFFSKVGFVFLGGSLAIALVQGVAMLAVNRFFPQWMESSTGTLVVTMLIMYLLALPLMMCIVKIIHVRAPLEQHRMTIGQWILAALMCYGITYASNLVGTALTFLIGLLKGSAVDNVLLSVISGTNLWVVFLFTVLCAPVYEEYIFRKLLVDRVAVYGEGVAVMLSGLLFGLFHGNLSQFSYAFCLGVFFGFIYVKTGRVRYTIALHMMVNFVGSVLPLLIMKISRYDEFMEALTLFQTDMAKGMAQLESVMPGLFLFAGYALAIFGTAIAGMVLLIINYKKFRLMPGQRVIPKGKRFSVVVVNAGMILFCVFWIAQIVIQLVG